MAKPLVAELSTKIVQHTQGLHVLFYRAALPLSVIQFGVGSYRTTAPFR